MSIWATADGYVIYKLLGIRANVFLIVKDNFYLLVDTGFTGEWNVLKHKLDIILKDNRLSVVVLTHTHYDHTGNLANIKKIYNPLVMVSIHEGYSLIKGYSKIPKGAMDFTKFLTDNLEDLANEHLAQFDKVMPNIEIERAYDFGKYGLNIKIISTPGHSIGSISLIVDNEIAICGDAISGLNGGEVFTPFSDDFHTTVKSWKKLLDTNCNLFLSGHGVPVNRKLFEEKYKEALLNLD